MNTDMTFSPAENLVGEKLQGMDGESVWEVISKDSPKLDNSPGAFSVGYKVKDQHGREAYMKASDLGLLTVESADFAERMMMALQRHMAEKNMLDRCSGNNMDRIVVAFDHGHNVVTVDGKTEAIFFLVFEHAERGDLRVQVDKRTRLNFKWCITALHDLSVAIQQLHAGDISHNDIKPANMLVFSLDLQKLADLGCATSSVIQSPHDDIHLVGDTRYASPENLYCLSAVEQQDVCTFKNRRASDIYHLASMAHYLFTGTMLTPAVMQKLRPEHRPNADEGGWTGGYKDIIPYWRSALSETLVEFEQLIRVHSEAKDEIIRPILSLIRELGEPDISLRGHPADRVGSHDNYSLARYVSKLANIKNRVSSGK